MTNHIERFENYLSTKEDFEHNIIQQKQVIILHGNGCNGKSYLTNQCIELIKQNNYSVIQDVQYGKGVNRLNTTNFERKLNNLPKKTIFHFLFDPFIEWNLEKPENVYVINMNHISFRY